MVERPDMFDKIANVMLHYFGDEAKELLEESSETMIGDFCDPYNFYTTIEWDELKDFVMENVNAINSKLDWNLEIIPNKSTLMQVCQMLRALANLGNANFLVLRNVISFFSSATISSSNDHRLPSRSSLFIASTSPLCSEMS